MPINYAVLPDDIVAQHNGALLVCKRKADIPPEKLALFTDNIEVPCIECGQIIAARPNGPPNPTFICNQCIAPMIIAAIERGDDLLFAHTRAGQPDRKKIRTNG